MAAKTNAVRILERAGIAFELREYVYDERTFSAEDAARQVGMPPERVFKTLLLHGDRSGHLFALIPAGAEVDLRSLALASGDKRVELTPQRAVQGLTGYLRGAVTVLAARHAYPVFIDERVSAVRVGPLLHGAQGAQP